MDKLTSILNHTQESTMNTSCSSYATPSLTTPLTRRVASNWATAARAWWTRWMAPRHAQKTEAELTALDGLSADTLKDIGAPEWMYERAQRAQERTRHGGLFERDTIHWR